MADRRFQAAETAVKRCAVVAAVAALTVLLALGPVNEGMLWAQIIAVGVLPALAVGLVGTAISVRRWLRWHLTWKRALVTAGVNPKDLADQDVLRWMCRWAARNLTHAEFAETVVPVVTSPLRPVNEDVAYAVVDGIVRYVAAVEYERRLCSHLASFCWDMAPLTATSFESAELVAWQLKQAITVGAENPISKSDGPDWMATFPERLEWSVKALRRGKYRRAITNLLTFTVVRHARPQLIADLFRATIPGVPAAWSQPVQPR